MSKKYYRFFGGLLTAQANWLNKMSEKGYRLIRTGKMLYEFEECKPNQVKYCVEFIGQKSKDNAKDYHDFWKIWATRCSIKASISTILSARCVGDRGLKKAGALQQTLQHLTGNC